MQSPLKRGLAIAAGLTLALGLAACSADSAGSTIGADGVGEGAFASGNADTLVFAVLPDHEGADQDAQPIADWIAEITGKNVEMFQATDYTAVVQGLAADQIDIAQISAFTYYQSQNAGADIEPIGAQITQEGAEPGYFSVAVKNPASDVETLADFADQAVCFVNPTSTSGFAVPMGGLLEVGVTVPEGDRVFGEEHDLNAKKVAEGVDCQVGFVQDIDADPFIESGELVEVQRVQVPAAPIVLQAALPQEVKDQLFEALADSTQSDLTDAGIELNEFLTDGWFGYGAVDDAYYDLIRTLCDEIADEVEACRA
ncbi:PhnD/SsuA/transferrin family substrate-binding protein [Microbacterium sp. GXF6406]